MAGKRDLEQQRNLSLRLYNILEKVGASEKMRKLHTRISRTWEILGTVSNTLFHQEQMHLYICGSTYEGSITPDLSSDVDVLMVSKFTNPVVLHPNDSPLGRFLLMVRDEWTFPGYVKLQLVWNGLPMTRYNTRVGNLNSLDEMGRVCRLHFSGDNMEGPADKEVENGVHISDRVRACKCNTLPLFLRNRLELLKNRNLISAEECEKFNEMGCMFVGAGHYLSPEKELEWRLSVTLQERALMSKLNPTQHKVFILLKMIRKEIIEKVIGCKVFTSYHCKTCVLYAVEMTSTRAWTPNNLIQCLLQCIKLFIVWLKKSFCPSFFNTDCNLFSKEGFSKKRKLILQTMELLLQTNNQFISMLQTDHIGDILVEGFRRWENVIACGKNERIYYLKSRIHTGVLRDFPLILHRLCGGLYDPLNLINALDCLKQVQNITEHTAVETHAAHEYLYPWFHLYIAKSLACLSYRCHNTSFSKHIMQVADVHFRKAEMTDLVNVRLAKAAVLYNSESYDSCWRFLQEIDNDYTYKVTRSCPCLDFKESYLFVDEREKHERLRIWSGMSIHKIIKKCIACSVIFLPSEFDIVPTPLQYEMFRSLGTQPGSRNEETEFWFDCSVIDAEVYLHFMLYLVSRKLHKDSHKQVAISNINAIIEKYLRRGKLGLHTCNHRPYLAQSVLYRHQGHTETAYNLLGWIYMQEQRYSDALQCFLKSWQLRPFHNAAKFHMRDLITKLSESPGQRSFQVATDR